MAFCVSFDPVKNNPYHDWIARGRPRDAAFMYDTCISDQLMTIMLLPHHARVHVILDFEYYNMEATIKYKLDGMRIILISAHCEWSRNEYKYVGGLDMFSEYVEDHMKKEFIFDAIVTHFFLDGWSVEMQQDNDSTYTSNQEALIERFTDQLDWRYRFKVKFKVIGYYDTTLENACASRIQAAYRGWRVRLAYRFNPMTSLGRFCVDLMFREVLKESL
jgi:hypothetical protein